MGSSTGCHRHRPLFGSTKQRARGSIYGPTSALYTSAHNLPQTTMGRGNKQRIQVSRAKIVTWCTHVLSTELQKVSSSGFARTNDTRNAASAFRTDAFLSVSNEEAPRRLEQLCSILSLANLEIAKKSGGRRPASAASPFPMADVAISGIGHLRDAFAENRELDAIVLRNWPAVFGWMQLLCRLLRTSPFQPNRLRLMSTPSPASFTRSGTIWLYSELLPLRKAF